MSRPSRQPAAVQRPTEAIRDAALRRVQTRDGRVRVEDYLTALAAATGEAVVVDAGIFDIEAPPPGMTPGSPIFGDPLNVVLSGDKASLAEATPDSVVGILRDQLVPETVAAGDFPSIDEVYRHVAASVGKAPWGEVTVSVPDDNHPTLPPLRLAFELRDTVAAAEHAAKLPSGQRHVLCALALALGLAQVNTAIDPAIGVRLALEVTFGVAKLTPVPKTALSDAAKKSTGGPQATVETRRRRRGSPE